MLSPTSCARLFPVIMKEENDYKAYIEKGDYKIQGSPEVYDKFLNYKPPEGYWRKGIYGGTSGQRNYCKYKGTPE